MKNKILLFFMLFSLSAIAQIEPDSLLLEDTLEQTDGAFTSCFEDFPEFPGGERELELFIQHNFKFPDSLSLKGQLVVQFTVEKSGRVSEIEIVKSLSPKYDQEIIRVFSVMPKWTLGGNGSIKERLRYTRALYFRKGKVSLHTKTGKYRSN